MAINTAAVIKGGLFAGLIINFGEFLLNTVVLANWMNREMTPRNLPPMGLTPAVLFALMAFGLGVLLVWVYAAIAPRFGPGARTAIRAGLVIWALVYLWPSIPLMPSMPSGGFVMLALGWGLAEVLIASIAGAYEYRQNPVS